MNFNKDLFESILKKYKENKLSVENNIITQKIELPDKFVDEYPYSDSIIRKKYYDIGVQSIQNGEFAAVIVNGGMATRFGGQVKGIIEVFDGKSFLELKILNIKKVSETLKIPINVYIMNSDATEKDTLEHFEKNNYFGYDKNYIKFFNQYVFKRVTKDGNLISNENKLYYGSGHGDFFYAFKEYVFSSLNKKIKYLFYSNVDNLGAYIDPVILGYHIEKNNCITVETAEKYQGDKGGAPAVIGGKPQIVEGFKFPLDFNQDSIKVFNTATYIFNTEIFDSDIELPFYVVKKNVDDSEIFQFERLAGDLTIFFKTNFLTINREERFFPIKTRYDLKELKSKLKEKLSNKI